MGNEYLIDKIDIWNRTDDGPSVTGRLSNFTVSILNSSSGTVWSQFFSASPSPTLAIDAFAAGDSIMGQFIRVQLGQSNYLSLAEVIVTGDVSTVPEPSTMLLFGCGVLGLASIGRKKMKK